MRWLTDRRAEDLGPRTRQIGAHADRTQIRNTLHGLPSLRGTIGIRKLGHSNQIVGYTKERLYLYI